MKDNKIVIGDLCGGAQMSVPKALKDRDDVVIYNVDIFFNKEFKDTFKNTIHGECDLTFGDDIFNFTTCAPKPDVIFASPMCRSFTQMLHVDRKYGNDLSQPERLGIKGDTFLDKYVVRDEDDVVLNTVLKENKFYRYFKKEQVILNAINDIHLATNVGNIIQEFKPKLGYIENPSGSILPDVLEINEYPKNYTYYSYWDNVNFSEKRTMFISNHDLNLPDIKVKSTIKRPKKCRLPQAGGNNETTKRVSIPPKLIQTIFESQFPKVFNPDGLGGRHAHKKFITFDKGMGVREMLKFEETSDGNVIFHFEGKQIDLDTLERFLKGGKRIYEKQ